MDNLNISHLPKKLKLRDLFLSEKRADIYFLKGEHYTFHRARYGLFEIAKILKKTKMDVVLLPAYHCESFVLPFEKAGYKIKFYKIDKHCLADLVDIRKKIDKNTKIMFLMHPFGFPNRIKEVSFICKKNNCFLIEDCVQSMFSKYRNKQLGVAGDVSLVSFMKFYPVCEGASIRINNPLIKLRKPERNTLYEFVKSYKHILDYCFLDTTPKKIIVPETKAGKDKLGRDLEGVNLKFENQDMSPVTKNVINNIDAELIIKKRVKHFNYLLKGLKNIKGAKPLFNYLPSGICPFVLPLIVNKEYVDIELHLRGVPVNCWRAAISNKVPKKDFKDAWFLSKHLLFVPIHQDLNKADLDFIAENIKEVCG